MNKNHWGCALLMLIGYLLASSQGDWFPYVNFFGAFLAAGTCLYLSTRE